MTWIIQELRERFANLRAWIGFAMIGVGVTLWFTPQYVVYALSVLFVAVGSWYAFDNEIKRLRRQNAMLREREAME
ncbi:MAG: hypothetical protein GVY18_05195 [Bacteroidetes bacterium]|jgi:putative Ca2+/H+ antiporter (TMEM165/GDT1 family)|nr:hypothetical protein [Bacteroidota bacterium]